MPASIIPKPETGSTLYSFGNSGSFELPTLEPVDTGSIPSTVFGNTIEQLADLTDQIARISEDRDLSDIGRQKKAEPVKRQAVLAIANLEANLEVEARHWDKREADLLAIPALDPTHAVGAIEAREARDWLRSLPSGKQAEVLERLKTEPGHEKLILAMLRSPIPELDHLSDFARTVWERTKRNSNPAESMAISSGRSTVEWGRRGAAHCAAVAKNAVGWDDGQIARTLLTSDNPAHHNAFKSLGLSVQQVELSKRVIAHELRKR